MVRTFSNITDIQPNVTKILNSIPENEFLAINANNASGSVYINKGNTLKATVVTSVPLYRVFFKSALN